MAEDKFKQINQWKCFAVSAGCLNKQLPTNKLTKTQIKIKQKTKKQLVILAKYTNDYHQIIPQTLYRCHRSMCMISSLQFKTHFKWEKRNVQLPIYHSQSNKTRCLQDTFEGWGETFPDCKWKMHHFWTLILTTKKAANTLFCCL